MRYYLDAEFIENGVTIDLISIGIVADDGREYYAINSECDFSKANGWVLENVLHPIGLDETGFSIGNLSEPWVTANYKNSYSQAKVKSQIAFEVMAFLKETDKEEETAHTFESLKNLKIENKPEIWGYYADYDWVVFCQLFGTMSDLPKSFPMYCRDIKQLCDELGNPRLPEQGKGEHNALADAKWNKKAWEFLQDPAKSPFSFSEALKLLRTGYRLARSGWNGKGIFIELQVPDEYSKMTSPYIFIDTTGLQTDNPDAPRSRVPWLASQTDLLASDWVINE